MNTRRDFIKKGVVILGLALVPAFLTKTRSGNLSAKPKEGVTYTNRELKALRAASSLSAKQLASKLSWMQKPYIVVMS